MLMNNNIQQDRKIIYNITSLFWELCKKNSNCYMINNNIPITIFHSETIPITSFQSYVDYIVRRCNFNLRTVIITFITMSKFLQKHNLSPSKLMAHGLFLVSLLLSNKINDDHYYDNNVIAICGGIDLHEMNFLEREFAKNMDYSFWINMEDYVKFLNNINIDYFEKIFNHSIIQN